MTNVNGSGEISDIAETIKLFFKEWQGAGGVILAEEMMIDRTINGVITRHKEPHSLEN